MKEITGTYRGMTYIIRSVESELVGSYFNVYLSLGTRHSLEMTPTFSSAMVKLAERIRGWDTQQKDSLMTQEQTEKRIREWKASWELLHSLEDSEQDGEGAQMVILTLLQTAIDLRTAGYQINDDETDWYWTGS